LLAVFVAAGTVLVPVTVGAGVEVDAGVGVSVGPTVLGTAGLGIGVGAATAVAVGMARTVGMVRTLLGCVGFGIGVCEGANGVGFAVIGVDSVGGVMISDSTVGMSVDMAVGSINSGSVGVFVDVGERSGVIVIWGVIVVDGEAVKGGGLVGVGTGCVTEAEGEGVCVRHVPGVARVRYCGHSSSCMRISRRPPGRLSQIR